MTVWPSRNAGATYLPAVISFVFLSIFVLGTTLITGCEKNASAA